jgi:hypothetical protein
MNKTNRKFPKDWKKQIEKSGKFFEQKIAIMIQNDGFGLAIPNYTFTDPEEGKSRELDVFVISAKQVGSAEEFNFIFPVLLVAIKNIPLICFTRKEIMSKYTLGDIHFSGMPKNIYSQGKEFELIDYLNLEKFHHYYKYRKISTQFWIPPKKEKELKSKEDETKENYIYRAMILPLIKAIEAEKKDHESGWYIDPEGEQINLQFYYPIIVVKELWECDLTKNMPRYLKLSRIGFLARYSSEKISGSYLIDICDEKGLKELLKCVDDEMDKVSNFIKERLKIFEKSALIDAKNRLAKQNKKFEL